MGGLRSLSCSVFTSKLSGAKLGIFANSANNFGVSQELESTRREKIVAFGEAFLELNFD